MMLRRAAIYPGPGTPFLRHRYPSLIEFCLAGGYLFVASNSQSEPVYFDGDTKAYYEASLRYLQEAKERIHALRTEVRELRKDYKDHTDTAEFLFDQAFQKSKENYTKLANRTASEKSTYATTVETLETEIRRCSAKLVEVKLVSEDAVMLKERAKAELKRHEEIIYSQKKRRELEVVNMRRTLDACKGEPMPTRTLVQDGNPEGHEDSTVSESAKAMKILEQIYHELKAVTGIADLEDMVTRFAELEDSSFRLSMLRDLAHMRIASLKEQNKKLTVAFNDLRLMADSRLKDESIIEGAKKTLEKSSESLKAAVTELDHLRLQAAEIRSAIEHIFLKLQLIKTEGKHGHKHSQHLLKHMGDMKTTDLLKECLERQEQLVVDLSDYNLKEKLQELKTDHPPSEPLSELMRGMGAVADDLVYV
ncbi:unnamed protein product [Schistocephalus solidus]|uniref:DUF4200 domain-containing protein n=1 Tax=Schistocephalus solidus TaxID=70667 RepID=A0A183SF39_SCHSO|nr:unnamed protein product [Schistocephalus solidus]